MTVYEQTMTALLRAGERGGKEALNCIAETDPTAPEQAAETDRRIQNGENLLFAAPVLVKDNIDVKGLRTTAGSLALTDNIASEDAAVIRNLRKNGAVILGKTNMTEFANYTSSGMPAGYSSRGGQVIHAADPSLSPSGSSSGSAVAVSSGIVPAAVGTDTSFSVIACSWENGICGLKPPAGVLCPEGIIPLARTLDSAGTMGRTFGETLQLYSAMRDIPLPDLQTIPIGQLRLAVNAVNRDLLPVERQDFVCRTVESMRKSGITIDEIRQPPVPSQRVIMQYEFMPHLEHYLRTSNASRKTLREIVRFYESNPETMMKYGIGHLRAALDETPGGLQSTVYLDAIAERRRLTESVEKTIGEYDAVIMTGPTNIMHFCGLPSAAVAATETNSFGVPHGLILYGTDEYRLWTTALTLEKHLQYARTI